MSIEILASIKEAEEKADEIIKKAELDYKNAIAKAQEEAKAKIQQAQAQAEADRDKIIRDAQAQAQIQADKTADDIKNQCASLKEDCYKNMDKAVNLIINTITGS